MQLGIILGMRNNEVKTFSNQTEILENFPESLKMLLAPLLRIKDTVLFTSNSTKLVRGDSQAIFEANKKIVLNFFKSIQKFEVCLSKIIETKDLIDASANIENINDLNLAIGVFNNLASDILKAMLNHLNSFSIENNADLIIKIQSEEAKQEADETIRKNTIAKHRLKLINLKLNILNLLTELNLSEISHSILKDQLSSEKNAILEDFSKQKMEQKIRGAERNEKLISFNLTAEQAEVEFEYLINQVDTILHDSETRIKVIETLIQNHTKITTREKLELNLLEIKRNFEIIAKNETIISGFMDELQEISLYYPLETITSIDFFSSRPDFVSSLSEQCRKTTNDYRRLARLPIVTEALNYQSPDQTADQQIL